MQLSPNEAGHSLDISSIVQLDSRGWVASEGILYRLGEEEFRYTAGSCDWLVWQFFQQGTTPLAEQRRQLELFAEHVLPAVR